MSNTNVFVLDDAKYKRNVDPINQYISQASNFLSISTGDSLETCTKFIKNSIKNKTFQDMHDPIVVYLDRNELGDREQKECTLTNYVYGSIKERELIAPTMTTYLHPDVKESISVMYVTDNIKGRGVAKKSQFAKEAEGSTLEQEASKENDIEKKEKLLLQAKTCLLAGYRDNKRQTNFKLRNNAKSGAMVSSSNVLYNKTGHSTLTSNCRIIASLGNANNEKVITGNRHYWSPQVVINSIVSIVSNSDYNAIKETLDIYNLYLPNVDDVIDCITCSTDLYWKDPKAIARIRVFLTKLNTLQLAAILYTGDLYHIKKHNDQFIRNFITGLSTKIVGMEVDDPVSTAYKIDENYMILAHQVCMKEVKGKGKDYKRMDKESLNTLIATSTNIQATLFNHSTLIKTFFTTTNIPSSVAYISNSVRKTVVTSDTDSTIFTVQEWIKWYFGDYVVNDKSIAVAGAVVFFASQSITHVLAVISANMGMAKKNLHTMAMKSEFFWPIFVNASVAKHYFALCEIQEGNVFNKYKKEIKGIHLKSSNAPKRVISKAEEIMDKIMHTVLDNKQIVLGDILKEVADFERMIISSIMDGKLEFFRAGMIKEPESYTKNSNESPYQHYLLWNTVFGPRYNNIEPPPYGVIKVPTILNNTTKLKEWLESINDIELRSRLASWLIQFGKDSLPTMYLSAEYVQTNGIPEDIKSVIDVRRVISDLCNILYIILETLGFYLKDGRITSDMY